MGPRPDRLQRLPQQYFVALLARVAAAAREDGPPLVDLGRGNPELGPPAHVVEALVEAARRPDVHGYAPIRGLRAHAGGDRAARYASVYGVELDPEREVALIPGTKTAIVELALVLANDGDDDPPARSVLPGLPVGRRARGRDARRRSRFTPTPAGRPTSTAVGPPRRST